MDNGLTFTSCMAPNADILCRAIVNYVGDRLSLPVSFLDHLPWQTREQLFLKGEISACWICGLPYVDLVDQTRSDVELLDVELLVAPVFRGDRYQDRPVYFSDVVVRQDSSFFTFADLRGTVWAYNEPRSHSGYYVTCAYLAALGETVHYFGQFIPSGAHQTSLQWLLEGKIDASAIDSTVLETELRRNPTLSSELRTIATLGPSPAPPWLMSTAVPQPLRQQVRSLLLTLHQDPQGQAILAEGAIARFAPVTDQDYNLIRTMAQAAPKALGTNQSGA